MSFVDGSVQADNPALCAYVEATTMYPDVDDFLVVSLGTGDHVHPVQVDEAQQWGLAGWAQLILDVIFHAASSTVDHQMQHLLPVCQDGIQHYYRFQPRLDGISIGLDDASQKNLNDLKQLANQTITTNDALIDQIAEQLLL